MRIITVKGTGNVSARPDYIILSLNIEVLSETYDRAMSEAAERIERLQGAAVRVGYRKEDLKTTSFDVQTRYPIIYPILSINFTVTVSDSSVTAPSAVRIGVSKTALIEIAVAAADAIILRLSVEYML